MIIYCATNKINGKKYIGQTSLTLEDRKKSHKHDSKYRNYVFGKAILKYGIDGFVWEILYECKTTSEMNRKEKEFIKLHNTYKSRIGYNMSPGGEYQNSKSRKRISQSLPKSLIGHKHSKETRKKIAESHMGQKHTDEAKRKMSIAKKGKKTWNTGLKMNDEYKRIRSISGKGKKKPGTSAAMKVKWEKYNIQKAEVQEK